MVAVGDCDEVGVAMGSVAVGSGGGAGAVGDGVGVAMGAVAVGAGGGAGTVGDGDGVGVAMTAVAVGSGAAARARSYSRPYIGQLPRPLA